MKIAQLERVLRLIMVLQSGRQYRPNDLAEALAVSRRTVFRDLDMLRKAGIPYYFDDDAHAYKIEAHCFLPPLHLTLEEALTLVLLSHHASGKHGLPLHRRQAQQAALKIENALPPHIQQRCGLTLKAISMRFGAQAGHEGQDQTFAILQTAIRARQKVQMDYFSFHEKKQISTTLSPYHLHFAQRAWYVIGVSSLHKEVRIFKVSRIRHIKLLSRRYILEKGFSIDDFLSLAWSFMPEGKIYRVKLLFAPMVAGNVAEVLWHRTQKLTWRDDSKLLFEAEVDGLREIMWWIAGYGDQVEVVAPPLLRRRIARMAQRTTEIYA